MKMFVLLLFILALSDVYSQNKWVQTLKIEGDAPKLFVVDSNLVYAITTRIGTNWLHKSTDQGKSWQMLHDINTFKGVTSADEISAPDYKTIYIRFGQGYVYRSTDSAKTFTIFNIDSLRQMKSIAMNNDKEGVFTYHAEIYVTKDGWETYEKAIDLWDRNIIISNYNYINDSIVVGLGRDYVTFPPLQWYFLKFNMNSYETEIHYIDYIKNGLLDDLFIINENTFFASGQGIVQVGGSGLDIVYKTTDGGKKWKKVLDLYPWKKEGMSNENPFGLQSIAFKDTLVGMAVGQFGKIVYTYDGGNTWIYESQLPPTLAGSGPPTMRVRYAGATPIVADYGGMIYELQEDNLAPKPSDTITICGRVTFEGVGQASVSVSIGDRITMTDEEGYYRFTRLPAGKHTVRAFSKFFYSLPHYYLSYKPYTYSPDSIDIVVTDKVCDVNFAASDIRKYYSISGTIKDTLGMTVPNITVKLISEQNTTNLKTTTTDENGEYIFENLEEYLFYFVDAISEDYTFKPTKKMNYSSIKLCMDTTYSFTAYRKNPSSVVEREPRPQMLSQAGNTIYVAENVLLSDCTLTISDLSGRELLRTAAKPEQSIMGFPRGTYIATLRCGSNILESLKVMKE